MPCHHHLAARQLLHSHILSTLGSSYFVLRLASSTLLGPSDGRPVWKTRGYSTLKSAGTKRKDSIRLISFTHENPKLLSCRISKGYATIAPDHDPGGMEEPPRNPFPYPSHHQPTAHQIFHLPLGATQAEIKARYYDLVRTHHPDSPHTRLLTPTTAHARFRNIKAAYDFLRGHTLSPHPNSRPAPSPQNFDPYLHELARRRRAWEASSGRSQHRSHSRSSSWDAGFAGEDNSAFAGAGAGWARPGWGEGFGAPAEERSQWNPDGRRERMVLALGVVTLVAGLFPDLPGTIGSVLFVSPGVVSEASPKAEGSSTPPSSKSDGSSSPSPGASTSGSTHRAETPLKSSSSFSFSIPNPFIPPEGSHRKAVASLQQVRQERTEMGLGVERREGIRQRVKDMKVEGEDKDKGEVNGGNGVKEARKGLSGDNAQGGREAIATRANDLLTDVPAAANDRSPGIEPNHQQPIIATTGIKEAGIVPDVGKVAQISTSSPAPARVDGGGREEEAST